jgi:hypothetical protein
MIQETQASLDALEESPAVGRAGASADADSVRVDETLLFPVMGPDGELHEFAIKRNQIYKFLYRAYVEECTPDCKHGRGCEHSCLLHSTRFSDANTLVYCPLSVF